MALVVTGCTIMDQQKRKTVPVPLCAPRIPHGPGHPVNNRVVITNYTPIEKL